MSTHAPESLVLVETKDSGAPGQKWRRAAVALISCAVVAAAALFVAAPAQSSVAFAVRESALTGSGSVVYGQVLDRRGVPVAHAKVRMVRWVDGERHVVRRARTTTDGLFRFTFPHPKRDLYNVRVVEQRNHHTYVGWHGIHIRPGRAYDVSARLARHQGFFFLPVSTY